MTQEEVREEDLCSENKPETDFFLENVLDVEEFSTVITRAELEEVCKPVIKRVIPLVV